MSSPFARILRHAVAATPGAVGGSLAAADGELVDSVSSIDPHEWAFLTAHHGIVLAQIQSALRTFHFGDPELLLFSHRELQVLLQSVGDGYFALLAVKPRAPLGAAIRELDRAAGQLRAEMA